MQKMMQNMNLFNQQQQNQNQPNLQQQILKEQNLHSESNSPGLGNHPGNHPNNEPEHQPFQRQQHLPTSSQPDHQPTQQSGLGGFGLGLSSANGMHQRSPTQVQQMKQSPITSSIGGGVIGQSSLGADASSSIGGYDPIKSL